MSDIPNSPSANDEPQHSAEDLRWIAYTLELAAKAEALGEVPVGAVLVADGEIIGEGYNQTITQNDPCAHAEILALRQAGQHRQNYRLLNTTLYVSLEPCSMCAGAMVHARVERLVFGAYDLKTGAAGSVYDIVRDSRLNHLIEVQGGVNEVECGEVLSRFFRRRRVEIKAAKKARREQESS